MLLALLSDAHGERDRLEEAIEIANDEHADALIFAGDLIEPSCVKHLLSFTGEKIYFIWGNNDGDKVSITKKLLVDSRSVVPSAGFLDTEIDGLRIFVTHYPDLAQIAAQSDMFHLVVYGHDHLYNYEHVGETVLINPGSILGNKGEPSFVLFDTKTKTGKRITLTESEQ